MSSRAGAPPRWAETTAVFGGTFDPPHLGHREAVRGLFKNPGVKGVLILPAAIPPTKSPYCSIQHRLDMVEMNFQSTPKDSFPRDIRIDTREITRSQLKPGHPNYTYDSLQELKSLHPFLAFVVGTDQLAQLDTWYRFPEVLTLCHWIILARMPEGEAKGRELLKKWEGSGLIRTEGNQWKVNNCSSWITLATTEAPPFSSSQIRESFGRNGTEPEGSLLPEVSVYLRQHSLYGIK